jgi:hypothetical protein
MMDFRMRSLAQARIRRDLEKVIAQLQPLITKAKNADLPELAEKLQLARQQALNELAAFSSDSET